jgi:protein-disulfide isomerase
MTTTRPLTIVLVGSAVLATLLAATYAASSSLLSPAAGTGSEIAARVGGRTVTLSEVDARWQRENPAEYGETMDVLYEGRKKVLLKVVSDILVESAAARRGMTSEQFVDVETVQRVQPVEPNEVVAFYAANADQLGGGTLDQYRERIQEVLERRARERAYRDLVVDLARESRAPGVFLEPPRQAMPVTETDPAMGTRDAPVTIVAYSDFQCPFCARVEPTLKAIRGRYGDSVRIVWKDFPLMSIHPDAFMAAEASHCAAEQGRYREYHDKLFAHQQRLGLADLKTYAADLTLDTDAFSVCLTSSRYAPLVQASLDAGRRLGVQSTPTLFVNGRAVRGAHPMDVFESIIDEELDRVRGPLASR